MESVRPFESYICFKKFRRKVHLKSHQKIHSGEAKFKCDVCGHMSREIWLHNSHIKIHDPSRKKLKCLLCKSTFYSKQNLNSHIKYIHDPEHNNRFQCIFCKRKCLSNSDLFKHLRSHTQERGYLCSVCGTEFRSVSNLNSHRKTHDDNRMRNFHCDKCGGNFYDKHTLASHLETHSNNRKKYKCDTCQKLLGSLNSYRKHQKIHLGIKKFNCSKCNKMFLGKTDYKRHLPVHFTFRKRHNCEHCAARFIDQKNLLRHIKYTHIGEFKETFKCVFCDKAFVARAPLFNHIVKHTTESPFICPHCPNEFRSNQGLTRHIASHHQSNRERPFPCHFCSQRSYTKPELYIHLRTHVLDRHYQCDTCLKRFKTSATLKSHQETHTDIRSYACLQCTKRFKTKKVLTSHVQNVHKNSSANV